MNKTLKIILYLIPIVIILGVGEYFVVKNWETISGGNEKKTEFSDKEITAAVQKGVNYPEDFYHEDLNYALLSYIDTTQLRTGGNWQQLCTDDKKTARVWSNTGNIHRETVMTEEKENEKYFEFKWVNPDRASDITLSRIHKCSYFDSTKREGINSGKEILGAFNQKPITTKNAKELLQYLHFIQHQPLSIILSAFFEQEDPINYVIYETEPNTAATGSMSPCGYPLIKTNYFVDKNSGEVTMTKERLRFVRGECAPEMILDPASGAKVGFF